MLLTASVLLGGLSHGLAQDANEVAKQSNDPANLSRRFDLDVTFTDSRGLGTIAGLAPSVTLPTGPKAKVKIIVPLSGSGLTRGLELGDLGLGLTYLASQTTSRTIFLGGRLDLDTGKTTRGTGQGSTTLTPSVGAVFNELVPGALVAPLLQYKVSIDSPRDRNRFEVGTFKLIYVHFLPEAQWLRLQPAINVDFRNNDRTTGQFLAQFGKMLSGNTSLSLSYEFNVYGPKPGKGSLQIGVGYLF